jgi:hypothetical protein
MKTDPEDLDLIERFLKNQLSHDEAVDFEIRVGEDHEFARKLRLRKTFPSLFQAEGHDEIVMDVEEKHEVIVKKKKTHFLKARHIGWGLLVLAAGVLIYFLASEFGTSFGKLISLKHAPVKTEQSGVRVKSIAPLKPAVKTVSPLKPDVKTLSPEQSPLEPPAPVRVSVNADYQVHAGLTTSDLLLSPLKPAQPLQITVKAVPTAPKPETAAKTFSVDSGVKVQKPIELESPADNLVVNRGEDIRFSWKQATDSFTNFYIKSVANNKLAWWRGIKPGIRECTVPANKLLPGKFYWYVGKKEYSRTIIIKD